MSRQKFVGKGDLAIRPEAVGLTWPRAPGDSQYDSSVTRDGVAVIEICGPLEHRGGWWFDSYEKILGRVEGAMIDEDVRVVLLDIDSPGGEVSGLQETVRRMRAMSAQYGKKIVACADDEMYSAAYALACAAEEIYLPESGGVGSIGVLAEVVNLIGAAEKQGVQVEVIRSGSRKAEGHPFIPLDDATIARVQARVDALAKQFFALVTDVRPVSRKDLEALQGACIYGKRAVNAGLADGVASFDEVFSALCEESFDNSASSTVSFKPIDRSEDNDGPGASAMFKVLEKKVAATLAALNAATTPSARKKATDAYAKAVAALTEAKVKKTYNKKTVEEESEEDDGEPDDDDKEDESAEASAEEEEGEESSEEEDEKKSKKSKKASSLAAFVKSLTGQSSEAAAQQVLESMHEQAQLAQANAAEIKKLKDSAVASERKALITSMVSAGQLKPAQLAWAETQTVASLKSYAKHTPAMFSPRQVAVDESVHHASGDVRGEDGLTDFERKLCAEQGVKPETYKAQRDGGTNILPKVN